MKTYQDLLEVGQDEQKRIEFVQAAISDHESSNLYLIAKDADAYYRHENPRILRLQKYIYDVLGRQVPDPTAANNKIPCRYYFYFVTQAVQYLLGNGVTFNGDDTKRKLGATFDYALQELATKALNGGVAFGYWNLDHLEVMPVYGGDGEVSFVPLYDEITGYLMAGIRYWCIDATKPLHATLFEVDGYTEYIRLTGEKMEIYQPKSSYIKIVRKSEATGTEITDGGNYPGFPVIPLYNVNHQSELCGIRNTIDAYDLTLSGLVNNVDEGNLIYWIIQNAGGMTDADDQRFVERLKTLHVVHTEDQEQVTSHSVEASFQPSKETLQELRSRLFEDAMAVDVQAISSGGADTATRIRAAYEPMNLKAGLLEAQVGDFILKLLQLLGIEDMPTFTPDTIVNKSEEIQTLIMAAEHLSSEYITKKILTILGDIDKYDEVMAQIDTEGAERTPLTDDFGGDDGNDGEGENE